MNTPAPQRIRRQDYAPPPFLVDLVELEIDFRSGEVLVDSRLHLRRNPAVTGAQPLQLDGHGLQTISLAIDGRPLAAADYHCSETALTIADPPDTLVLCTRVRIDADHNGSLSGLYRSADGYFTQCEAQGFRRITWFPDRPDIMSPYVVNLRADRSSLPVLLANGNPVARGRIATGRAGTIPSPSHATSSLSSPPASTSCVTVSPPPAAARLNSPSTSSRASSTSAHTRWTR